MLLPIVGIIATMGMFLFSNFVAWTLLILQITPDWTIWAAGIANFVFGCVAMSFVQWLKEAIDDRYADRLFAEEERKRREKHD